MASSVAVAEQPITVVQPRAGLLVDLRELIAYRELLCYFVWRDLKVTYKQTLIGAAWAILQPLCTMLVFTLIFGRLAQLPSDGLPYPVFFYSGLLLWTYFANALARSTNSLVQHQTLITKVYFPRILLPVSAVLSGWLDFAIGAMLLVGLLWHYQIASGWPLLAAPLFFLLATLTACAVGVWLSALNALYRDVRYAMPFAIQLWMFASPIAYSSSLVPSKYRLIYGLNPMATAVDGFRWALTGSGSDPTVNVAISLAVVVLILVSGVAVFHRLESHLIDVI